MGQITSFDLTNFINDFKCNVYFETGTGEGVSLEYVLKYPFEKLYSVDIDGDLISAAMDKFKNFNNIQLIHDYSSKALETYVPTIPMDSRILFFLDAHFPGADFHKITYEESIRQFKKDAYPLEDEINIIKKSRNTSNDVIIVDDLKLYEDGEFEHPNWEYKWLQDELNLNINSKFIYEAFRETHIFTKDYRHQGYLILTPKIINKSI